MDTRIRDPLSIDIAIERLNSMLEVDPDAVARLIETRIPCDELADHPTAQVHEAEDGLCYVGHLGLLNGIFGIDDDGWGPICALFEDGELVRFEKTHHHLRHHHSPHYHKLSGQ